MHSFDIETLLQFKPPELMCQKCRALLWYSDIELPDTQKARCPICNTEYLAVDYPVWEIDRYLKQEGCVIKIDHLVEHGLRLATIAHRINDPYTYLPPSQPLGSIYSALLHARSFVHFAAHSLSAMLLSALRMASGRVLVRGIVSPAGSQAIASRVQDGSASPRLELRVLETGHPNDALSHPWRNRLMIIDGLLAFQGVAFWEVSQWRNPAEDQDTIRVVTDIEQVAWLNNHLFSPVWAGFDERAKIQMINRRSDDPAMYRKMAS